MANLRPIQLHVRDELKAFLELDEREHFARDHQEIIDDLRKEQWIGDNKRKPNYQCFDDFAFVSELARFLDDLELWNEEIGEIRTQYFWDKETSELPERFLCVFGFTSPITKRLDYLKSRCRTIVSGIDLVAVPAEQVNTPALQKDLSGKPALAALFGRLSYRRWETIDSNDERNIQRLTGILLKHGIEIERPRGERKARLKKLSN